MTLIPLTSSLYKSKIFGAAEDDGAAATAEKRVGESVGANPDAKRSGALSRCYIDLTLRATFSDSGGAGAGGNEKAPRRIDLRGVSHSVRCPDGELDLSVSSLHVEDDVLWWKSVAYTALVFAVCAAQCALLVRQMRLAAVQSRAAKMSVATIGAQALLDSYMCLGHIMLGIWPRSIARWSISPLIVGALYCFLSLFLSLSFSLWLCLSCSPSLDLTTQSVPLTTQIK